MHQTIHRVSGDDTGTGKIESRDAEEDEDMRFVAKCRIPLKRKLLIKCLRAVKPLTLRGY